MVQAGRGSACSKRYNVVHLIYRHKEYEGHYKDFQLGLSTMREHWQSGLQDIRHSLAQPDWLPCRITTQASLRLRYPIGMRVERVTSLSSARPRWDAAIVAILGAQYRKRLCSSNMQISNKHVGNRHRGHKKRRPEKALFPEPIPQSACNECPRPPIPYFNT